MNQIIFIQYYYCSIAFRALSKCKLFAHSLSVQHGQFFRQTWFSSACYVDINCTPANSRHTHTYTERARRARADIDATQQNGRCEGWTHRHKVE